MRIHVATAALTALVLAACDSGGSAVETRERATTEPVALISAAAPDSEMETVPEAKPPVTANRRETADAKIQRLYERNGGSFGAKSADDYLVKVRAFTEATPKGTETVKRPNGDTLYYQASTNTFAVTDRNGVPRTMFKPDDGPAYWAQQKERAPTFGQRRSASSE
ncbi:pyocin large subunit-like protein [Brevundimonas bullata]|uniref:Pyocin large subunit-like protein n=1 Tax=Brevundimonas bullata TaxID=13160 RepID=A0A7W7N290_9CAUL|nr:S-type pyocin family protein [Brevundimonas bullata]MBB4797103.1 pyocin large subunit-like protein [Brevundimonas bullata]MBB6382062.1 pyocin large subunit-like protein [Brevundimonas bullata]